MLNIDLLQFIHKQQQISGKLNLATLKRINNDESQYSGVMEYVVTATVDPQENIPYLELRLYGKITTLCQYCLGEMELNIDESVIVHVFKHQDQLDKEIADSHNAHAIDGIVADKNFNLDDFIEDEIIMLLPIAPKHEVCSQ